MAIAYVLIFVLSLIMPPLYFAFIRKKQDEPWLLGLFLCVCVVTLGYFFVSISKTVEGIRVVEQLFKKKVAIHILNIGLLEHTPMGRFFLTTMLAVAELERNMIVERTQIRRTPFRHFTTSTEFKVFYEKDLQNNK